MNSTLRYKDYIATIHFDADDEIFVGRLIGINDVIGFHADTVGDLKIAFHEAVDDYIATCEKVGKKPQKAYSGKLMFRVSPELHAKAVVAAEAAGKSLNQWGEDAIRSCLGDESHRRYFVFTNSPAKSFGWQLPTLKPLADVQAPESVQSPSKQGSGRNVQMPMTALKSRTLVYWKQ